MLNKNELEKLSTKRLLAYKKKHFSHRWDNDHGLDCECGYCLEIENDRKEHNETHQFIKDILKDREHV